MASSQAPLTPGRKSRRSWFDTPPLMSLDPKPVQDENARPKKPKRRSMDSVETLTLTHFTSAPRLGFGNAVVGSTKFRTLIIRNPHDYEQEVIIEKFPFKKKFYVDHTRFEVAPGDVFSLEIAWTPEEAVGVREMVQFHIDGVYRLQCYLFGTAENPKPVRKTRRRKFCPPGSENVDVIQTPALTRIKSNYNPRRSQELRDMQALVENKTFHHNNAIESKLPDSGKAATKEFKPSQIKSENEENTFVRPHAINSITPTVLESTSIGLDLKHEEEELYSSSQQSRTKRNKMLSYKGRDIDNTMMAVSPIPVISDGHQNGMTIDSFFRPSEMGVERPSNVGEHQRVKDTFVVPQAPMSGQVSEFPRSTFICTSDVKSKDIRRFEDAADKSECLSSTVYASSKNGYNNEMTYNIADGALTPESCKSNVTVGDKLIPNGMSPSTTIEFNKRVEWQSPQRAGTLNVSNLSSVSPNTILDQSLSFIAQDLTPVKKQRNYDIDISGNSSLISAGYGMVSPNSFMEEMKSTNGAEVIDSQDSRIPSPSTVFNDSIPHNVMLKHLDNINTSLLSNSPLFQSRPLVKSKGGTKRRSLTTAYRVAEKKKTSQTNKSPPKENREKRSSRTQNSSRTHSIMQRTGKEGKPNTMKRNSPVKRSLKSLSSRRSPRNRYCQQKMRRSPGGKPFSPVVLRGKGKQLLDCSTPMKQSPSMIDSGTVVKNQSSNSFNSPVFDPSPKFPLTSPSFLPTTPNDDDDLSSRRATLTVVKSRPSDALLTAMNNNRKKLFENKSQPFVHFAEINSSTGTRGIGSNEESMVSKEEHESLKSDLPHEPSPSNQFYSPTGRNLPNSPNPDNSRRSTHVVKSPKVLDLNSIQQKRLNFEDVLGADMDMGGNQLSHGDNITLSLEAEVKSRQNSPITFVCTMSPSVVDYEITSDDSSRQSLSIDSLETSQCGGAVTNLVEDKSHNRASISTTNSITSAGFECEYRVDVLNDTRSEEGVIYTNLKTPCKEIDWSFCEKGDMKVLPPKKNITSTFTFEERNVEIIEEMTKTSSVYVTSVAGINEMVGSVDTTEKIIHKKKLRRSVSAHDINSSPFGQGCDYPNGHANDVPSFTQDDISKPVVLGERQLRQAVFSGNHGKNLETSKVISSSQVDKPSTKNGYRRLRSNVPMQQKSLGNRSQSLSNINHNSNNTHKQVISDIRGRGRVQKTERAPLTKTAKNSDRNIPSAKAGVDKLKKVKGPAKGVAQSKLILVKKAKNAVPRHPMPFAARNMYYDERWMEKQESGFVQWLNFVLTPPDEYVAVTSKPKVDAVALTLGNQQQSVPPRLAPTKEVLSFRAYAARRRLNRLRRAACQLYQSDDVANIIRKIEVEVESQRIAARKDRKLHADLGIKQRVLDLLLQYSSLWLRVGLETVFGEVLPLQSNTDVVGLSRFIVTRLLSCPDIAAQYAHPSVPHLYTDGFASAMSRHTVKKFLLLIYFMDKAKTLRLIDHDPCLFCKDADIKSSKEILIQFSRDLLSGEGDLTRHLAYLGYTVCQVQKPFDEFDYAVANISSDLKDGLRLSRLLELLAGDSCIMGKLRTPAISRLQKIHNMEVFFSAMIKRGFKLEEMSGTTARDVVDGHREKTLSLLWHLILHFQASLKVDEEKLKEEIHLLTKSLQLKLAMQKIGASFTEDCLARRDSGDSTTFVNNERMQLIFRWCRLVCLHYGVKIENMTVSFSDGRALCCLLHHYHPVLLPLSDIRFQTSQQFQEAAEDVCDGEDPDLSVDWGKRGGLCPNEDDPAYFEKLLGNERSNFKVLYEKVSALGGIPLMVKHTHMSNTIPDEKVVTTYVSYLCLRLLDIREEVKAARVIQMAWRRRKLQHTSKQRLWATRIIQKWYRKHRQAKLIKMMEEEKKMESAAIELQAACRLYLERRRLKRVRAVTVIQSFWRMKNAQKVAREMTETKREREREERIRQEETAAAVTIQKFFRAFLVRREWNHIKTSVRTLQSWWRIMKAKQIVAVMKLQRQREVEENFAALTIQKCYRGFKVRKEQKNLAKSVTVVQSLWRMRKARCIAACRRLQKEKENAAALRIQKCYQDFTVRKEVKYLNKCATVLQCFWRVCSAQKVFKAKWQKREQEVKEEKSAITIQKCFRGWLCRREMSKMQDAAICLQKYWRGYLGRKRAAVVLKYLQEDSAVVIQKWVRGWICRQKIRQMQAAAICIQRVWRAFVIGQYLEQEEEKRQTAATIIQAWYKRCSQQQEYQILRSYVIYVQRKYHSILKGREVRADLEMKKEAAITLQRAWKQFVIIREAKGILEEKKELRREEEWQRKSFAAVVIQSQYRGYKCRQDYKEMRLACVKMQSVWRVKKAKMVLYALQKERMDRAKEMVYKTVVAFYHFSRFQKMKQAAIVIQKTWKRTLSMRQLEKMKHSRKEKAALCIQRNYKAHIARSNFLRLKRSAVTLQTHWRCYLIRQELIQMQMRRNEREQAACVLQAFIRGVIQRRNFLRMKNAAAVLQNFYHSHLLAKQQMENNAATVIQSVFRGHLCYKKYTAQRDAALVIQDWYRRSQMMASDRMKFIESRSCAVTIQSYFRMYRAREDFLRKREAVIKLQAFARRLQVEEQYHLKRNAALIIQMYFRAWKSGRIFRQAYVLIRDSCITIQRFYRKEKARKERAQEFNAQNVAAVKIQSCFKRYVQRKQYLTVQSAVTIIQRKYRAVQKGRDIRSDLRKRVEAVLTVQRSWRKFVMINKAKKVLEDKREKERVEKEKRRNNAAIVLQKSWQRMKIMREAKKELEERRKAKQEKLEEEVRRGVRLNNAAALVIQQAYKQFKLVQAAKAVLKQIRDARQLKEQRREEEQMRQESTAAKVIQQSWMRYRRMIEARAIIERKREEIRLNEQHYEKEAKLKNKAACQIQQAYKKFKQMQKAKWILEQKRTIKRVEEYKRKQEEAAVSIQLWWRQKELMKDAKSLLNEKKEAKFREMENNKLRLKEEYLAAATIQKAWRRVLKVREAKLVSELSRVSAVPGNENGYMEDNAELERKYEETDNLVYRTEMRENITEDEITMATNNEEKVMDCVEKEIYKMDASEADNQREDFERKQNEGDGNEGMNNVDVCEERLVEASKCEIYEDNVHTPFSAQQDERRTEASITIQKYFRGYLQKSKYVRTIRSVILVQSLIRAHIQRTKFKTYKAAVSVVQQRWRERNASRQLRETYLLVVKAVRVIQCWYRLARKVKTERAATRIQALWRGHAVRRDLKCKKLKAARKRLQEANKCGKENTLGSRTASALAYLLADNDMAYILSALMNLEVSTRLSHVCCERLVEANAVSVLVKLLSSCNRSVPHMEIIKYTTDILLNLAYYDKTVDSLMEVPNMTPVVLNVMQIFREKGAIFYKSCAFLGTLAQNSARRQVLLRCPQLVERVRSMHSLALRKQRVTDRRQQQRTPAKLKLVKTATKEFNDPLTAITFVMTSLRLDPK